MNINRSTDFNMSTVDPKLHRHLFVVDLTPLLLHPGVSDQALQQKAL